MPCIVSRNPGTIAIVWSSPLTRGFEIAVSGTSRLPESEYILVGCGTHVHVD